MMAKCIKADEENILKVGQVYNLSRKCDDECYTIDGTGLIVGKESVNEYFTFPQCQRYGGIIICNSSDIHRLSVWNRRPIQREMK